MIYNPWRPVDTVADLPPFCSACGRPMRVYWEQTGFNPDTGRPWGHTRAVCTVSWWRAALGPEHDKAVVAPPPDIRD